MNTKYQQVQEKIKELYKAGNDKTLVQSIYNLSNPAQTQKEAEDLREGTQYSKLSNDEFYGMFSSDKFNKIEEHDMKHLFQELHNRYMKSNEQIPERVVEVGVDAKNPNALGYVTSQNNTLFINKAAIDKAKIEDPAQKRQGLMNSKTIGYVSNFVVTHESQHACQFEAALDLVLGKEMNPEQKFLAAVSAMEQANLTNAMENNDILYALKWKKNYKYQYIEHDANMQALMTVNKNMPKSEKDKMEYGDYEMFSAVSGLRGMPLTRSFANRRVKKMEKFLKYEMEYFNQKIGDCPLKSQIQEVLNDYTKENNNQPSKFNVQVSKEIGKMMDVLRHGAMIKQVAGNS